MIRVVVCTHNGVRFLKAQLESILQQETPVDVVHIFDFASSDGTRNLLGRLSADAPRLDVRLVETAPGVTRSFFHAFEQILPDCAAHDVIFLSDQDDIWLPTKTRHMLKAIDNTRMEGDDRILAFHDVTICDAALNPIRSSHYLGRPFRLPRDLARDRLLIANPVIGHTIAITQPLLDLAVRCLRPAHYVMHDWALTLLAAYAGKLVQTPENLGMYRQHDANILGAGRKRSVITNVRRALRLSRSIAEQARAFVEDLACAAKAAHISAPPILGGHTPLELQLAVLLARDGHTFGHRAMAVAQVAQFLSAAGRESRTGHD